MKQGWEIKKLGKVCDFQGGSQPPKSQFIYEPKKGYVRFLQIRDFASDKNITYIPESKKNRYCNEEDILLGRYGASVGKVLINKAGAYNVAVMKTIPNESILYKRYLYYYLNTEDFQTRLLNTASRSAQDGFSKDDIFDFPILITALPEQQRIVSILDKAFAAIAKAKANAEQNLKNAKELFESYLQGVFENKGEGWEEKTLGEVCSLITDGKHGDCENEENSGYYFLSAKDVRNGTLLFDNARQITKSGFEETHKRTNLKPGDICMVNTGATIGRISFAPDDPRTYKATFQKSVAVIKTIPTLIDNNFCCYILQSDLKKLVKVSSGTAVPNLLLGDLKRHKINLPKSKEAQQTIVRQLDALRAETQKLEAVYQQKIANLDELKKSILQLALSPVEGKAFAAELKTKQENITIKQG